MANVKPKLVAEITDLTWTAGGLLRSPAAAPRRSRSRRGFRAYERWVVVLQVNAWRATDLSPSAAANLTAIVVGEMAARFIDARRNA